MRDYSIFIHRIQMWAPFGYPAMPPLAVQFCVYLLGHILIHLAYYLCDALLQLMQGRLLEMGKHTPHCSYISEE